MISLKSLLRRLLNQVRLLELFRKYRYLVYCNWVRRLRADSTLLFKFHIIVLPGYSKRMFNTVVQLDPFEIRWGGRPPLSSEPGKFVMGGDWDIICKMPIEQYIRSYPYCRTALQMFEEGRPYHLTEQYREMIDLVEQGHCDDWRARNCKSLVEVERYFAALNKAWASIKQDGYKTQEELGKECVGDEINVCIDRFGEFHKQVGPGHHRLVMARLLRVPQVPVVISRVHYHWAKHCVGQYGGDLISAVNRGIAELASRERRELA